MRRLAAALLCLALVGEARAQQAVIQEGVVVPNAPVMFRGDRKVRQGAGAAGAEAGKMITGGIGIVGGICDFTDTTENSPVKMCLDAATGSIIYNGVSYPPTIGSGNVSGPTPTALDELASWNSLVGGALRQGAAKLTDNKTTAITTDGASLLASTSPTYTALQIMQMTSAYAGPWHYDALSGVASMPTGSTVAQVSGVAGYVVNNIATGGAINNAVGLFGVCVSAVNNAACWGANTIVTDNTAYAASAGVGKAIIGYEADFIATSANSVVTGMLIIGESIATPATSYGYRVGKLSQINNIPWQIGFLTDAGGAVVALEVGGLATAAPNISSQLVRFDSYDGASALVRHTLQSTAAGFFLSTTSTTSSGFNLQGAGGSLVGSYSLNVKNVVTTLDNATVTFGLDPTWTGIGVGNATSTLSLTGATVSIPGLTAVAAGTGKRFLCIDTVTKRVYEGSGASCI